jgi:hypothetical protein
MVTLPPSKKQTGRPAAVTATQEDVLRRYVLKYPFKTVRELKREVSGWHDIDNSIWTIQKVCQKKLGMPSRSAAKKPLLTAGMVKKRLSFCKKYRSWTAQHLERVMLATNRRSGWTTSGCTRLCGQC